jgi:hypothetical protein
MQTGLTVEIINIVGPGGGAWSGGKFMMIKGSLARHGQSILRFKALRISSAGMWGTLYGHLRDP